MDAFWKPASPVDAPSRIDGDLPTIRSKLVMLILACILPSMVGFGALIFYFYETQRAQLEQDALQTARAMTATVDRALRIAESVALALSTSRELETGDFAGFHQRAKDVLRDAAPGFAFVLSEESGQQVVNTLISFGDALPRHGNSEQLRKVFATGKPVISDLYTGGVLGRPVLGVDVPVWRNGKVAYDLSLGILPETVGAILSELRLPSNRIAAIYDSTGTIVARTHLADRFIGQSGAPAMVRRVREATEGSLEVSTLEGTPVLAIFSRSLATGWTVVIGIPRSVLVDELRNSLFFIVLLAVALLCLGMSAAWILGSRIGRSVSALKQPAMSLGSGNPVMPQPASFAEEAEVSRALQAVERQLDQFRSDTLLQHERLEQAKIEADRANVAKSRFLTAASHDLRQPVQAIVLLLATVERLVGDHLRIAEAIALMKESVQGLNGLLTDVLDISRFDSGVVMPTLESVDVGSLIGRLTREYNSTAHGKRLELRAHAASLHARTDIKLLERILRNLIENALYYTDKGGVLVGARLRGDQVRIDVIDTGVGIPADKQTEIFEEFRQLQNPGRDVRHGLGLGLSIVYRIAGLLGAELEVSSKIGRGTRISLLLPAKTTRPAEAAAEAAFDDPGGCVLVIEDNAIVRHGLETMLREWGYAILTADSGEDALAIAGAKGGIIDAIVADHRLGPGLSGAATVREIEYRVGRSIPTLIITGDTALSRVTEVHGSGFVMLHKPVNPGDLRRTLAQMLSRRAEARAR